MKKFKRILLTMGLTALSALSIAGLSACEEDEKIEYSFNTNGGAAIENVEVGKGDTYTLPVPKREGYAFEGWYTSENFSGEPVTSVVAEGSVTYYAKWAKLSAITLELNGGSLSETTLYLKAGENVYDLMKNYVPTKNGLTFGGWFDGTAELTQNKKMPESGLTLTAKYKVAYTVEIYLQNTALNGYERAEDVVGYGYVGAAFTSEQKLTGFKEVIVTDGDTPTVSEKTALSENAEENVFRHYFDRESYTVRFDPNYPDESAGTAVTVSVLYGTEVQVPADYAYEGYCLVGWATSASGEAAYKAYYVDTVLYNNDGEVRPADTFVPERNTTLYAVWAKGYTDMFGGNDYVYLLGEEDVAYLARGDVFFKGEYNAKYNDFIFEDEDGKIKAEGRVYENGTFSYINETRTYTMHTQAEGLVKNTKIIFDEYNGLTYSTQGEDGKITRSTGTFTRDFENNCYIATFTDGELAGQTMTFITSTVELDQVKWSVFRVRNEEELNMGKLVRFAVSDGSVLYYKIYEITLDGFGVASYNNGTTTDTYYYTLEDGLLTLTTESGTVFGTARVVDVNGRKGYMLYTKAQDREFTLDSGDTLKLDGGGLAVYTVNGKEKTGYYTSEDSSLGSAIVTVYADGEEFVFLVTSHTEDVPVIDGNGEKTDETEQVTTYTIEAKPAGYAEYRYVADGLVYMSPLLVLNDTEAGRATLYGHKEESGEFVKVAVGSYVENSDGYYVYTVTERFDGSGLVTDPFDLSLLKSFVFRINDDATKYSVTYWQSSTMEDGTTTEYVKNYVSANGEKLQLVGGFAFLTGEKLSFVGAHSTKDGVTTLINGSTYYYAELYEDGTFLLLQYSPYTATVLNEDNTVNKNESVAFDGKGNATYVIKTPAENEEEEAQMTEYVGTVKNLNKKTDEGMAIYRFESSELTFEYIVITSGNYSYIAKYSDTYNGTYESVSGMLSLDGFGYMATYTNAQGDVYTGRYRISTENFVALYIEETEKYFYFDLKGNAFTVRSEEYGTYLLVDNQYQEYYIELDGYDKASIYELTLPEGAEEYVREYLDENGTYTVNGDVFTVVYKVGNETFTIYGKLDSISANGNEYATLSVIHEEVVRIYVNEKDWSVLILDDIGNAVKYDKAGVREEGSYTLVTDSFLYYVNDALSDACIYEYDTEKGTATPVKFTARGYYTEALESLLFSEYGYAYFGSTRYYYNVENGQVLLYRHAKEGELANAYGYVEDDTFGSFTNVKTYDGKTYYANDGFAIGFSRDAATKDKFPVQVSNSDENKYALESLSFQPGTGDEFQVVATVLLNGKNYDCYVVRTLNDANEAEMYISLGYYRFYINVTYKGTNSDGSSNNTYEVVDLRYVRPLYSYTYLNAYYFNAIFFVSALKNNYGMITIHGEYDEAGEMIKYYVQGEFMEASGLKDTEGNIIGFEEAAYGYSNGVYMARFTAEDGYTYSLYFGLRYHSAFGLYGYSVVALARQQTLETENGYAVQVERVVATEMTSVTVGQIYTVTLKNGEETLSADTILLVNGTIYYVVRTKTDDGKITETKYYKVKLVEEDGSSVEGGTATNVAFYKSATVEAEDVTTVYTADGKLYVDISAERGVTLIALYNETIVAVESSYDESTSTYTVRSSDNRVFTVKLVDGVVEINETMATEA